MTTRAELLPPDLFPEYDEVTPHVPSVLRFVARFMQDNGAQTEMKERLHKHYLQNWRDKVSPEGVAKAILGVCEGIKI